MTKIQNDGPTERGIKMNIFGFDTMGRGCDIVLSMLVIVLASIVFTIAEERKYSYQLISLPNFM
jgi:hypothetical protein